MCVNFLGVRIGSCLVSVHGVDSVVLLAAQVFMSESATISTGSILFPNKMIKLGLARSMGRAIHSNLMKMYAFAIMCKLTFTMKQFALFIKKITLV